MLPVDVPKENTYRNPVRRGDRIVNVKGEAGVAGANVSGDGDRRRRRRPSTSHLDLSAADVKLRGSYDVKTDLFRTNKVVSGGDAARERERQVVLILHDELEGVEGGPPFGDPGERRSTSGTTGPLYACPFTHLNQTEPEPSKEAISPGARAR